MRCSNCHKDILEDDCFCSNCGKPVSANYRSAQVQPVDNSPREVLRYLVSVSPEITKNEALFLEAANNCLKELEQGKFSGLAQGTTAFTKEDLFLLLSLLHCGIPEKLSHVELINDRFLDNFHSLLKQEVLVDANAARSGIITWAYAMGLDTSSCSPEYARAINKPAAHAKPELTNESAPLTKTSSASQNSSSSSKMDPLNLIAFFALLVCVLVFVFIQNNRKPNTSHQSADISPTAIPTISVPDPNIPTISVPDPNILSISVPDPNTSTISVPDPNTPTIAVPDPNIPTEITTLQKCPPYTFDLPNGNSLEMLWCPEGSFMMGSPEGELGQSFEESQHRVTLTQGFWLGKYEVTQAQFRAVMGYNPSYFTDEGSPVECVSWQDSMNFCQELNNILGKKLPAGYRFTLPTEAQWEYACRAGTTSALNSGQELTTEQGCSASLNQLGWYCKNSDSSTHRVGQKKPNAWGFYDMHGNVLEWCLDWYDIYSGAATDPLGPSEGQFRAYRGGSWKDDAMYCRSAFRSPMLESLGYREVGLRAVLAPVQ